MLKKDLFPKYIPHPVKKTTSFPKSHPGMMTIAWLSFGQADPDYPFEAYVYKLQLIGVTR
jgi:hypothetical protein